MDEINKTKEVDSFSGEVAMLLQKAAKIKPGEELEKPIAMILLELSNPEFKKEYLK